MRQYVLTRSSFDPAVWPLSANRRRLEVSRAVTVPLIAAQTFRDFTWIVLLHPRDPLLEQRLALYGSAATFRPLVWRAEVSRRGVGSRQRQAAADDAFHDYHAPWRDALEPRDEPILMSRIDDDDGFAPDALARMRAAAEGLERRTVLMQPVGFWTYRGVYARSRHERNAMHALFTPPGDTATVYDYSHVACRRFAPTVMVDERPAWLWVRHGDTISSRRLPHRLVGRPQPLDPALRAIFPLDWERLGRCWR